MEEMNNHVSNVGTENNYTGEEKVYAEPQWTRQSRYAPESVRNQYQPYERVEPATSATRVPEHNNPVTSVPVKTIPLGNRELLFGLFFLLFGLILANSRIRGGFNLGFAVAGVGCVVTSVIYLWGSGHKGDWYSRTLLLLCLLILPGFARSDDEMVKRVMLCFLIVGINLGLTVMAGKNLRDTVGVHSLLDPFRTLISQGFGEMPHVMRGIGQAFHRGGAAVRSGANVILGLMIAVPIVVVMIFLLMRADAAFEGIVDLLPEVDTMEIIVTIIIGSFLAIWLFSRTVLLHFGEKRKMQTSEINRYLSAITMNTVLGSVCLVYLVYLFSQLAYFAGGFAGVLPEGYSTAEYARRGFFEMAWLCMINLSVIIFAISKTRRADDQAPKSSRILCFIIGMVTLFLVVTAGAKMMMYIGDYGMSRLRVLTMVIMVFLGITTALVSVWLFLPRLPYMRIVVLVAMVMGIGVFWIDVDTQVAKYNVESYLSGKHQEIDMHYLSELGSGAMPYIDQLAREATDPEVVIIAKDILKNRFYFEEDLRGWNYLDQIGRSYQEEYRDANIMKK